MKPCKNVLELKQSKVDSIKDKNGEVLVEKSKILGRWTEYCSALYNHKLNDDVNVVDTDKQLMMTQKSS